MGNKTWKQFERRVARFFNSEKNPLSGGNSKHLLSDTFLSIHEML